MIRNLKTERKLSKSKLSSFHANFVRKINNSFEDIRLILLKTIETLSLVYIINCC